MQYQHLTQSGILTFTALDFEDCQEEAESVQNQKKGTINWQNNYQEDQLSLIGNLQTRIDQNEN